MTYPCQTSIQFFNYYILKHNPFTEEELVVDSDDEYQYEEVPIDEIFIGTGKLNNHQN